MTCTFTNTYSFPGYTGNTQYRIIISTGPDQWLGNHDRLGLTTGWVKSRIYTKNTQSCIMTSTGYYRLPSNQDRLLPATLYIRFTRLGKIPLNTLKIHGCVLGLLPVTTGHFIFVLYKNWDSGRPVRYLGLRPCFAHHPDYSSVFTSWSWSYPS